jgi:AcrR family transcriptional regulator
MSESRTYQSPRRRQQAEETRRAILGAARTLFAERGYAATALSDIAEAAGVSVPTLYSSIGSKATIARALVEFTNEQSDIPQNDRIQQATTNGPDLLRANAHLVRVLNERSGDIIRALLMAAASEPELAPALEAGRRYHREAEYANAYRLAGMQALRPGISAEEAGAIITTLALPEVIGHLAEVEGWSFDKIEAWLAETLIRLLLKEGA